MSEQDMLLTEIIQIIRDNTVFNDTATTRDLVACKAAGKEILAKVKQHIGNCLNEPCPNNGDPIYMCPRCVRQLRDELLGKQHYEQNKEVGGITISEVVHDEEIPEGAKNLILPLLKRMKGLEKGLAGAVELAYRRGRQDGTEEAG